VTGTRELVQVPGAVLRALREQAGLTIRQVERIAAARGVKVTNSNLSRVEREQADRPVSPAVRQAYEIALCRAITADTLNELLIARGETEHRSFATTVATIAAGGLLGEYDDKLLDEGGAVVLAPGRVSDAEVEQVEQAAMLVRTMDLGYGGAQAQHVAYQLLRWAAGLRSAPMAEPVRRRLRVGIGALAGWAAWAAFDGGRYAPSRVLFMMALGLAVRADEPDLRAHVLADVAAHHNQLGSPDHALRALRLADGDERIGPAVRSMLYGVRARAYATLGERGHCARETGLAEDAAAGVDAAGVPGWLGGWEPAHALAVCGHAWATLAGRTRSFSDLAEAHKRLEGAVDDLAAASRHRAAALCLVRLAWVHQRCGSPEEAAAWLVRAQQATAGLGSARVSRDLAVVCAAGNGGASGSGAAALATDGQR
jgi:transcriptional regulator with XRE-family HTH domain